MSFLELDAYGLLRQRAILRTLLNHRVVASKRGYGEPKNSAPSGKSQPHTSVLSGVALTISTEFPVKPLAMLIQVLDLGGARDRA